MSQGPIGGGLVPVEDVLCTDALARRPTRAADHRADGEALMQLTETLIGAPQTILQTLVEKTLEVLEAGSAGISLLTEDGRRFYWPAIAGKWKAHIGGGTPREFGPCGDVLDRGTYLLFDRPQRRYAYLEPVTPPLGEALLVPLHVAGQSVGTLWAIAHDDRRKFDREDLRRLQNLARFAGTAYHVWTRLQRLDESRRAALNLMEDAVQSRELAENLVRELREEIGERERTEALLRCQKEALERVAQDAALTEVLEGLVSAVESDPEKGLVAAVHLLDASGAYFETVVAPGLPAAYVEATEGLALDSHAGPCCDSALNGGPVFVADFANDGRWPRFRELASAFGIRACSSTPIFSSAGRVIGTFAHYFRQPLQSNVRDQQASEIVNRTVALAIEQRQARTALVASEYRLRGIFDTAAVSLWEEDFSEVRSMIETLKAQGVTDFRRHFIEHPELVHQALGAIRVLDVNDATLRMFEAGHKAEIFGSLPQIFVPESMPVLVDELVAVAEGRTYFESEALFHTVQGNPRHVFFTMVLPPAGQFYDRVLFSVFDITQRVRAEEALRKSAEELESANRSKSDFIAVLGHELRGPLNAICGWAEVLKRSDPSAEERHKALEIISRNGRMQGQLIADLLDSERISTGKLSLELRGVDLGAEIDSAIATTEPAAADKRIRVEADCGTEPAVVLGDSARLQQVLGNLLSNAVKFTPEGGQIRVRLRVKDTSAELSVSDTGQGIPMESLPFVFERFRQAESVASRRHGGLGLGLSVSKHLVELHGGTLSAESAGKGQGATFTISLPLVSETSRPAVSDAEAEEESGVSLAGLLVLVVDDDHEAREPVRRVLEGAGADVIAVRSANDALEAIKQQRPDVLVSDLGMPRHDGFYLIRMLRTFPLGQGGRIPAIALTAFGTSEDRKRALDAGFTAHVAKPVDPAMLIGAVSALAASKLHRPDRRRGEAPLDKSAEL